MLSSLRPVALGWLFSRARWIMMVVIEVAVGAFFLFAPDLTMQWLGIRRTSEAAALFRLYGIALACRGLMHHASFDVARPGPVRTVVLADLFFAGASALVLALAVTRGLAGAAAWAVVAFFAAEVLLQLVVLAGTWTVSAQELARARAARD